MAGGSNGSRLLDDNSSLRWPRITYNSMTASFAECGCSALFHPRALRTMVFPRKHILRSIAPLRLQRSTRDWRPGEGGNISHYSLVPVDYVFPANFAHLFRYNEQALVYSGLLAG